MASRETAKDRASRIPYDYQHQPDHLIRWRIGLTALALVAAGCWVVRGLIRYDVGRSRASHGPLIRAHATWDMQCNACHVPLPALRWGVWNEPYGIASDLGDKNCKSCHMGNEDQVHHTTHRVQHCTQCHTDHQGREASLVLLAEGQCTSCHGDLDKALVKPPELEDITRKITHFYDGTHPKFRSAVRDPGRLKFNHALHMAKGMTQVSGGKAIFTFAQLAEADRPRYGWKKDSQPSDPVKLDCASCHGLEGGDFPLGQHDGQGQSPKLARLPSSIIPERSTGSYMIALVYEHQCAACHPLDVPGRLETLRDGSAVVDERRQSNALGRAGERALIGVPHRLQPGELHDFLEASYVGLLLADDAKLKGEVGLRALPGPRERAERARREVDRRVESAEKILFGSGKGTCTECHYYGSADGRELPEPADMSSRAKLRIMPTRLPSFWFEHARFDHSAHRALDCRECHARAYPDAPDASGRPVDRAAPESDQTPTLKSGKETWTAHEDVLIPDIAVCQKCHAPHSRSEDRIIGGAGYDCIECHTYHNGHQPRQGRGAAARGVQDRLGADQFQLGTPSKRTPP